MSETQGQQDAGEYIPLGAESRAFSAPNVGVGSEPVAPESTATLGLTMATGLETPVTEMPAHDPDVSAWEGEGGFAPPNAEAA